MPAKRPKCSRESQGPEALQVCDENVYGHGIRLAQWTVGQIRLSSNGVSDVGLVTSWGELDSGGGGAGSRRLPGVSVALISIWTIPLAKFSKTDLAIQLRAIRESCFKAPGMMFKQAGMVYYSVAKSEKLRWGSTREGAGKREQASPTADFQSGEIAGSGCYILGPVTTAASLPTQNLACVSSLASRIVLSSKNTFLFHSN